jgi:hypothetical protein
MESPMRFIILVIATGMIFLIPEAMMLPNVIKPLFEGHLGDALLRDIRALPSVSSGCGMSLCPVPGSEPLVRVTAESKLPWAIRG